MAKITYKGPADVRVLTAADLKVEEFEDTSFRRNESTEVPDEVAEKLLTKPRTYGRFIRTPENTDAEAESADTTGETPSPDSTSQLGVDSPAGDTAAATVGGSSTSGSPTAGSTRRSKA